MTKRVDCIRSSEIRKIFEKAAQNPNLISLGIGQPNFNVPEEIKKEMIQAIKNNKTSYTPSQGIKQLTEKILKKYPYDFAESTIITSGVSGALFLIFSALLEEKDEIIIFDPYFLMYPDLCKFLKINPVIVKTNPDFSINLSNLKKAITPKTKAILINSPNNPSGYVYSKQELQEIVKIAKQNNLWLISDEVYEDFDYDSRFVTLGSLYPKTIVTSGFSKNFSLTGLRVGYAVGPKKIIDDMIKLQQYTFVCAPSIAQNALVNNLELDISKNILEFKKRRDLVYEKLKHYFSLEKPQGAFYAFLKLPEGITGKQFSDACFKENLLIVPGFAFSQLDDHIRISYATNNKDLEKGLDILIKVLNKITPQRFDLRIRGA